MPTPSWTGSCTTRSGSTWARQTCGSAADRPLEIKKHRGQCRPRCPSAISAVPFRDIRQCSSEQILRSPQPSGSTPPACRTPRGTWRHGGGVAPAEHLRDDPAHAAPQLPGARLAHAVAHEVDRTALPCGNPSQHVAVGITAQRRWRAPGNTSPSIPAHGAGDEPHAGEAGPLSKDKGSPVTYISATAATRARSTRR